MYFLLTTDMQNDSTPLDLACMNGHTHVAALLMENGADHLKRSDKVGKFSTIFGTSKCKCMFV